MILLQHAQKAVRRKVGTHLHQYGQSFTGDSNWRCLRGYGRQQTFVWHKRFSQRSSTPQRNKQKSFGQDERRDERNSNCWVCLPSAKNSLNPGREAKHQKVERHEKVCCEKKHKACALQRDAFLQKTTNWTCFTSKGMRFMGCGWTKSLWAHLIQSDVSQKTEYTLAYGHRLTEELDAYISELLEVILSKEAQSLAWAHFVNSREQALWECWSILQCCRPLKTRQGLWLFPTPLPFSSPGL